MKAELEWDDVQDFIERLEFILLNVAETNDKFAYPILALERRCDWGVVKDSGGRVLKMEEADASFVVDQPNANQSIQMRLRDWIKMFMISQTL